MALWNKKNKEKNNKDDFSEMENTTFTSSDSFMFDDEKNDNKNTNESNESKLSQLKAWFSEKLEKVNGKNKDSSDSEIDNKNTNESNESKLSQLKAWFSEKLEKVNGKNKNSSNNASENLEGGSLYTSSNTPTFESESGVSSSVDTNTQSKSKKNALKTLWLKWWASSVFKITFLIVLYVIIMTAVIITAYYLAI